MALDNWWENDPQIDSVAAADDWWAGDQISESEPADYRAMARRIAEEEGIDPDIYERQIEAESNFDPNAQSGAGAQGIAQFMPATAKDVGLTDPFDPEQALRHGARYYKKQLDLFGDPRLALAAYNAGGGNVNKYGGVPPFEETEAYVKKIYDDFSAPKPATEAVTDDDFWSADALVPTDAFIAETAPTDSVNLEENDEPPEWNTAKGLAERGTALLGGLNTVARQFEEAFVNPVADKLEDVAPIGGFAYKEGDEYLPSYLGSDEYKQKKNNKAQAQ